MVLSAIFAALSVVILFFGGLLGDLDLTISAIASLIVLLAIIEMGVKWGVLVYAVTSVISLVLFPSYFITPMYILFVGIFPVFKYFSDKLRKIFSFILKFAFMNVMLTVLLLMANYLYAIDIHDFTLFGLDLGAYAVIIAYVLSNITLIIFDYCLDKLMILYNLHLSKVLGIYKLFK